MPSSRPLLASALALVLAACAATPPPAPRPAPALASPSADAAAHENLNAVLWMQHATEYRAVVLGAFALATRQLELALADPQWDALPPDERRGFPLAGLPPAVIVDADETMIDNSAFQAESIRDEVPYDVPRWQVWVERRAARALPGALEFARAAEARGVTVLFVTNRRAPAELAATADNLRALGFSVDADGGNLLLAGDPRGPAHAKSGRRAWAAARYRVLLLLGDNLGDFIDQDGLGLAERAAIAEPFADWWGERWIMLPNPSYGSWESAVLRGCAAELRERPLACKRALLRHD